MTEQGQQVAAIWRDDGFARDWAQGDSFRDMLAFPRHIAAAIVAGDNPDPATVVDVGSGPGDFLAVLLQQFPSAHGIWTDASPAMLDLARERLAEFGDRVDYRIVDMTALTDGVLPAGADVITTSRAAHHLDRPACSASMPRRPGCWHRAAGSSTWTTSGPRGPGTRGTSASGRRAHSSGSRRAAPSTTTPTR